MRPSKAQSLDSVALKREKFWIKKEPPDDFYYFELFPGLGDTGSIYHFMLR